LRYHPNTRAKAFPLNKNPLIFALAILVICNAARAAPVVYAPQWGFKPEVTLRIQVEAVAEEK